MFLKVLFTVEKQPKKKRNMNKRRGKKLIKILITIIIFVILYYKFNIKFTSIFSDIKNWTFIFIGLFCRLVVVQGLAMNRWHIFLKYSGVNESIKTLTKISFLSSFLGVILPSSQGGDIMRMYIIEKRHSFSAEQKNTVSSSVIIERMIGFILLAGIGLICSLLTPNFPYKDRIIFIIFMINVLLWIVVFFLTNKKAYKILASKLDRIKHMKSFLLFLEKTHHSLVVFPYKKVIVPSVLLIGALQFTTIFILYLVFLAFDIHIPLYYHMALYPIIAILSIIPVSISGLGLREGFFIFFYSTINVIPDMAVKISLINYTIEVLSAVCMGGIIFICTQFHIMKKIL